MGETAGEHPPLAIPMRFVEPGNVVYNSHPPHLGPHGFELAGREIIFFTKGAEIRHELFFGIF
jgi:hypothetical protein